VIKTKLSQYMASVMLSKARLSIDPTGRKLFRHRKTLVPSADVDEGKRKEKNRKGNEEKETKPSRMVSPSLQSMKVLSSLRETTGAAPIRSPMGCVPKMRGSTPTARKTD